MFDNLTKEIFYYSVIPVAIIAVIIVLLIIIGKKKDNNYYKFNYSIKVLLSILLAFILSIMIGYTVWVYERIINLRTLGSNILYMIALGVIVVSLLLSLVIICVKLNKSFNSNSEQEKELSN